MENNMTDGVWAIPAEDRPFNMRKADLLIKKLGRPLTDEDMEPLYREAAERDKQRE
ncbi:hypothetical protein [Periweissella cryptocerci]|uniref:hypothetical protein n=1 Tax=Periweissella cryptocerci TaxID=2506420 RepID=UPI001404EDA1|nr:hypothetical protein [Periweissella cryptocerci]